MKAAPTFLALLTLTSFAHAQESTLNRYSLDNGLDVVLVPDHRVPMVIVDISYRVGAMNEPPGRSGFAHLFEHLMFAGTPAYPNIDEVYGAEGIFLNAFTWDDRTTYYAEGMSSALPLMLSVEADRMANQGHSIEEDDLVVQRDIVLNEMRQNILDTVGEAGMEALRTGVFPSEHPYSRTVIGSMPDLAAATIADVKAFFDTYYVPNNATLVVLGDFDPVRARELIETTFGAIPRGADVAVPNPAPFDPRPMRLDLEDKVPTPMVLLGWSVPALQAPERALLRIVAETWSNPDYGLFRRTLVDSGLATSVEVMHETGRLGGRFMLRISVTDGEDPAAVEAAAKAAVTGFLGDELTDEEVDRERRRILLDDRSANERLLTLADNILSFTEVMDDPLMALGDDPELLAATPDAVMVAARRFLDPDLASSVIVRPGDRGVYPAVLTESSGVSQPLTTLARPAVDIPMLDPDPRVPAPGPKRETATLSNGMEVVHYRVPKGAMDYLGAFSSAGTLAAPKGKEGIVQFASAMAARGPLGIDGADFARELKTLGATLDSRDGWLGAAVTLSVPPDNLAEAARLFADAMRNPAFDSHEWEVLRAATLDDLGLREGELEDVAVRYAESALLQVPGAPLIDRSLASVEAITLADVKAIYPRLFSPANVTFYSVGPSSIEAVAAALEAGFGDWASTAEPLRSKRPGTPAFPRRTRVLLVPEPGASQSVVLIAMPAPSFGTKDFPETKAVHNLLAYDFISRVNSVIREEKGFTYATGGSLYGGSLAEGSIFTMEAPVDRDVVGATLEEVARAFASLASEPPREDEVRRTRVGAYTTMASFYETTPDLFDTLWAQVTSGVSLEALYAYRASLTQLDLEAVRRVALRYVSLEHALIVVVGDPDVVRPQLEALGYGVELVERDL